MKPGDEVVCIDPSGYEIYLEKDKVYVVDAYIPEGPVTFGRYTIDLPEPHVVLVGMDHCKAPWCPPDIPAGWKARRFRPVKKTDISIFNQLLTTLPVKVNEDA